MKVSSSIKNEGGSMAIVRPEHIGTHSVGVWNDRLLGDVVPRG